MWRTQTTMKVFVDWTRSHWFGHFVTVLLVVKNYQETFGIPSSGSINNVSPYSTPQKVTRFFTDTRNSVGFIRVCKGHSMMCKGRCGSKIDSYPTMFDPSYKSCSCDQICHIYDDCCWDFDDSCPDEFEKYRMFIIDVKRLSSVKSECHQDTAVVVLDIDSESVQNDIGGGQCDENIDIDGHNNSVNCGGWEERDYREPIVDHKGIQFQNISVYQYYMATITGNEPLAWNIKLESPRPLPHRDLEEFLFEGKATRKIQTCIEHVPPEGVTKRTCKADSVHVDCGSFEFNHIRMSPRVAVEWCQRLTSAGQVTIQYSTSSSTPISTSTDNDHTTILTTKKPSIPGFWDSFCQVSFVADPRSINKFAFSLLLKYSRTDGLSIESFESDEAYSWDSLRFLESDDKSTANQIMIKICSRGFFFNGDSCVVPKTFLVRVVDHTSGSSIVQDYTRTLSRVIEESFQNNDFKLMLNGVDQYCNNVYKNTTICRPTVVDTEFEIVNYNLTFDGSILPITRLMFEQKRDLLADVMSSLKRNQTLLTLCFVSKSTYSAFTTEETEKEKIVTCDRLFWDVQDQLSIRHFRVKKINASMEELDRMTISFFPWTEHNMYNNERKAKGLKFLLLVTLVVCMYL